MAGVMLGATMVGITVGVTLVSIASAAVVLAAVVIMAIVDHLGVIRIASRLLAQEHPIEMCTMALEEEEQEMHLTLLHQDQV